MKRMLEEQFMRQIGCDCRVVCPCGAVGTHKALLRVRCPAMFQMLRPASGGGGGGGAGGGGGGGGGFLDIAGSGGVDEIHFSENYGTVVHLLLWLYTDSLPLAAPGSSLWPSSSTEGVGRGVAGGSLERRQDCGWSVEEVEMHVGRREGGCVWGGRVTVGPFTSLVALELTLLAPKLGLGRWVMRCFGFFVGVGRWVTGGLGSRV